ncbi:hypothetical protein ARMGADRAFT_1012241 [Armillaria gallica]|uniref:Extracellular membrane protein CFEM domain-containing protein n=1 Tax=Armillaria gallica TaxID=47427 RepID=A0A2H3DYI9_ARMGA|nr:hypothetical protein ARMGADRAFT_1012241 [Armillaria gallica]
MRLESFDVLSVCLLCFVTPVQGQSSSTTSITAGSATRTTISGSTTTGTSSITESSSSTTIRTTNPQSSGSVSASSTLSAELPSLSGYSICVTNCLQLSIADANCTVVADVNYFCPRTEFTTGLTDCCSPMPKRAADGGDPCPELLHLGVYEHITVVQRHVNLFFFQLVSHNYQHLCDHYSFQCL